MYPGLQRQQHIGGGVEGESGDRCDNAESHCNKVDHVCVAVRRALTKLGPNKYLLSIITTHVKMTHPELETVLGMIKQLKGKCGHVCVCEYAHIEQCTCMHHTCTYGVSKDKNYFFSIFIAIALNLSTLYKVIISQ
jgi:hypothetical protein